MPTINRLQKKPKTSSGSSKTDMQKLRSAAYNNTAWRKMRDTYMHEHPLCEECLKKGKITAAEDVHHKTSPFKTGEVNYRLLLDYNNLESVCKKCHQLIHNSKSNDMTPEEILRQLDALFDQDSITDKDIEDGTY